MSRNALLTSPAANGRIGVIRRLPVPRCEPPYDDERDSEAPAGALATGAVQGTLALSFVLPSGLPALPQPPPLQLLLPQPRTTPAVPPQPSTGSPTKQRRKAAPDSYFGPQQTPRTLLPEPRRWAVRFVQALLEVLAGDRPSSQLIRWTDATVLSHVQQECGGRTELVHDHRQTRLRAHVRSVRVYEPADGVAEVCALISRGTRVSAVALRFEGFDGRWQCTALELGTDAAPGAALLRRSASAGHRGSA